MAKITWDDRTNSGEESKISASIFNDTKTSVNALYDIIEAQLGNTSSTADEDLIISGTIYVSGSIIPNADDSNTSSFDLGSATNAWNDIYVSDGSIKFVKAGESTVSFTKEEVSKLQSGKSISKTAGKQLVNELDTSTYVRMSTGGRAYHYASNKALIKLQTGSFELGDTTVPAQILGSSVGITGSVNITGSSVYTTTDLLTLLGNFGQTGSFAVTGSSSFTGDVNMDGAVTTQDLLTVVAGMNTTGSVNITGSTTQTGSMSVLPPPMSPGSGPVTKTLFYGYLFTGGTPDSQQVQATASYAPYAINYFRFSTSSQKGYNDATETSQTSFFTGVSSSASNQQFADLFFTPTFAYPSHSYHFKVNSAAITGSYSQVSVTFIGSSSLDGNAAPTLIEQSGGGANGRWKFMIPPPALQYPTGGFAVGDLLNVLAAYGQTGVPTGSLGDYNFDGQVTVNDLMLVLSGYGNPNTLCSDLLIPENTNHQLIGPTISICDGNVLIIPTGSYCSITF